MLAIVGKVKSIFCGDFVREIIRREKSTQIHEETKREAEPEKQTQTSESDACE